MLNAYRLQTTRDIYWINPNEYITGRGLRICAPVLFEMLQGSVVRIIPGVPEKYTINPTLDYEVVSAELSEIGMTLERERESDGLARMSAMRAASAIIAVGLADISAGVESPTANLVWSKQLRVSDLLKHRTDIFHAVDAHQRGGMLVTKDVKFALKLGPLLKEMGIEMLPVYGTRPDRAIMERSRL